MKIKKEKSVSSMPYFIFFLILFLSALVKKDVKAIHAEPRKESLQGRLLYQKYEHALKENDSAKEEGSFFSAAWDELPEAYREFWEYYVWDWVYRVDESRINGEDEIKEGVLAAYGGGDGFGMRIAVCDEYGVLGYEYFQDKEYIYLSVRGLSDRGRDLPEYTVGINDWEQTALTGSSGYGLERWEAWVSEHGREAGKKQDGQLTEYCIVEGKGYSIDRERGILVSISGCLEEYVVSWLATEAGRVRHRLLETEGAESTIRKLLPEGFAMTGEFACCDLNEDGWMDYVAVASCQRSAETGEEPLLHDYNDAVWLFLSRKDGGYEKKQLTDARLICGRLDFVGDGILSCEDSSVLEKSYNLNPYRFQYFFYDPPTEDFYFYRDFQVWVYEGRGVSVHGQESLGEYSMWDYYGKYVHRVTQFGYSGRTFKLEKNNREIFRVDTAEEYYVPASWWLENAVTKRLREAEYSLAMDLLGSGEGMEMAGGPGKVFIYSTNVYMDERVSCQKVRAGDYQVNVLVDRRTGEAVDVPQLIPLGEMLSICREGMKDIMGAPIEGAEKERYLECLQRGYGQANSMMPASDLEGVGEKARISIGLTAWGLQFEGVRKNRKGMMEVFEFYVDKEYFFGTPLWQYMEPEKQVPVSGHRDPDPLRPAAAGLQQ